jgi:hypothetical protein
MENISPVIFFIIYLAISAWAKNRKAQAKKAPMPPPPRETGPAEQAPVEQVSKVNSIFEQIKAELLELEEEPTLFRPPPPIQEAPVIQVQPAEVILDAPRAADEIIQEGSSALNDYRRQENARSLAIEVETRRSDAKNTLDSVLDSYSKIEQGIILSEILGKPRALQDKDTWYHSR